MKSQTPRLLAYIIIIIVSILCVSQTPVMASQGIFLETDNRHPKAFDETTVRVSMKDIPGCYGVDIRLSFDPTYLEVVDSNRNSHGIQVTPGEFLNPNSSFFIINKADNKKGVVKYAASLLNPALPAQGDGVLAKIVFRVKEGAQKKRTVIGVEKAHLGTREGKTIILSNNERNGLELIPGAKTSKPFPIPPMYILILVAGILIGGSIAGLILFIILKKRDKNR